MHVDIIIEIFKEVRYSESGSNDRIKEEATYALFIDYLDECEKGKLLCFFIF